MNEIDIDVHKSILIDCNYDLRYIKNKIKYLKIELLTRLWLIMLFTLNVMIQTNIWLLSVFIILTILFIFFSFLTIKNIKKEIISKNKKINEINEQLKIIDYTTFIKEERSKKLMKLKKRFLFH